MTQRNDGAHRKELDPTNPNQRRLLGRKNYLFAGSDIGGETAATFYSLIETAKLNNLNPQEYLCDMLGRIADHPISRIDELLPWNTKGA